MTPQRPAARRLIQIRRQIGDEIRRLRLDAGLSRAAVAAAAGISPGYLCRIEDGERLATLSTLIAIGDVLGADTTIRFHPNTGPTIHDRHQAAIASALVAALRSNWVVIPEAVLSRPVRGSVDLFTWRSPPPCVVAMEIVSRMSRVEQEIRWFREKALALPSSDAWRRLAIPDETPIEQLLVLRVTRHNLEVARAYGELLAAAYPAPAMAAHAALFDRRPWPGSAILWADDSDGTVHLRSEPPRGVRVGR